MMDEETIVAASTPPGKGAIAVLRLSGAKAPQIVEATFVDKDKKPHPLIPFKPLLGYIYQAETDGDRSRIVDQVVVTYFKKPHSYTGEDVVEISCHGSPVITKKILGLFVAGGARLAGPGEFTLRAFLNGKMDLAQAEAVRDVIEAKTFYQARMATQQLEGELSKRLQPVKEILIEVACHLESKVEFVEEDIQTEERTVIVEKLDKILAQLKSFERSFEYGKIVHDGFTLAIVGRPNVGKSSLFNAILYEDRAIVTEIPGTTRDTLTESANVHGIPVRFIDTAGIRKEAADAVERVGIERSVSAMTNADLILFVIDASDDLKSDDHALQARLAKSNANYILVVNKIDLPAKLTAQQIEQFNKHVSPVAVSAKEGLGIETLKQRIFQTIAPDSHLEKEDLIITSVRHKCCISSTIQHTKNAQDALRAGLSEEFALYDLHLAHRALGEITGETTIEDLLGKIFSTFCIGK